MQKQHVTLHDQFSRVKMLQMGACFVWKENPGGSNPFFMNVGPGISADIGARIILAPSFGISLEDMKTKIKGKVPQPAYQSNLFGPPAGCQGFLGLHPIWFDADWIYLIILNSGNNDETNPLLFSGRCTKNISRPKFLRICGSQLLSMADAQEIRMWHDVTQLIGISNSCLPIRRLEVPPHMCPHMCRYGNGSGCYLPEKWLVNLQCDRLWEPMGPFWAVSLILICLGMFLGRQVTISGKSELLIDGATGP